ncbi:MAG TPA: response regulator [Steroidobacteraceae bacterium]|nr:response regulator [Steroidobacteraceae bacterium]
MSDAGFTVFIVDDDPAVLRAVSRLLRAAAFQTRTFASPREFLAEHEPSLPGCAVFDVAMPDLDGLALQQALAVRGVERPIIFITARGDVPTSVRAMKAGAVDFLTKPVSADDLLAAVARARQMEAQARQTRSERASIDTRLARLTLREREVFTHVVAGKLNKQIAWDLGTVEKTIKVHRGRMMHKLGMRTIQDLVRFAERARIPPFLDPAQRKLS